jgi:hypothetical protein
MHDPRRRKQPHPEFTSLPYGSEYTYAEAVSVEALERQQRLMKLAEIRKQRARPSEQLTLSFDQLSVFDQCGRRA